MMQIDGRCHCGRISYVAEVDPGRVSICHCRDCQTFNSSAYRVSVLTARDNVRITGTPRVYAKTADSGAIRLQHFCEECGTPIFNSGPDEKVGDWVIRWGSIRQRDQLPPARQIWCGSSLPWIDDLAKAGQGGEIVSDLIPSLRRSNPVLSVRAALWIAASLRSSQ